VLIETLIFIAFGAVTGLFAGLLGIGGGVISVPVLYYTLKHAGFPESDLMHVAVATSLASTLITSFGAAWTHHQKKAILRAAIAPIAVGLLIGCASGAVLASYLDNEILSLIFGLAVLPLSVYFFFPRLPSPSLSPGPNWTLSLWGVVIGCFSSLLGVGGGIFFVPVLLGYRLQMKNAIATSSAATLASAFFGSAAFLLLARVHPELPWTVGYINIPAFLAIGLSSLLTAPLGATLAHTLPTGMIKRIFACALAATGITMLQGP